MTAPLPWWPASFINSIISGLLHWGAREIHHDRTIPFCRRGRVFNGPACVYRGFIPGCNTLSLVSTCLFGCCGQPLLVNKWKGSSGLRFLPQLHLQWVLWFGCQTVLHRALIRSWLVWKWILCFLQWWKPYTWKSCWCFCCAPVNLSELERMRQIQKSSLASRPFSMFPLLPCVLGKESLLPHMCF